MSAIKHIFYSIMGAGLAFLNVAQAAPPTSGAYDRFAAGICPRPSNRKHYDGANDYVLHV